MSVELEKLEINLFTRHNIQKEYAGFQSAILKEVLLFQLLAKAISQTLQLIA